MALMKRLSLLLSVLILASCGAKTTSGQEELNSTAKVLAVKNTDIPTAQHSDTITNFDTESEFAEFYVVIADTNTNYYNLRENMILLSRQTGIPIDTLGRYYNAEKNLIALPDDSDDEIYAGDYFPRRADSGFLSLEYLKIYKPNAGDETIALVEGLYVSKANADSALQAMAKTRKGFILKSEIYMGCLH